MPELVFKGKEFVYNHHLSVPFRPLVAHADKGIGDASLDDNLIIHGDNLHALKALLPMYAGKVDCIFIDPPYNTGNEGWSYNDNVNSPMLRAWLNSNPITIEDGLRHDKWAAMMFPRLRLLHELLADYGSMWITLDSNELPRLLHLLAEIFGEEQILSVVTTEANPRGRQSDVHFATVNDYLVCVAKDASEVSLRGLPASADYIEEFKREDADGQKWRELGLRQRGADSLRQDREDMFFPIYISPATGEVSLERSSKFSVEVVPRKSDGRDGRWSWSSAQVNREINRVYGRTVRGRDGNDRFDVFYKDYLTRGGEERRRKPKTIWDASVANTEMGGKELIQIMGEKVFEYPKPRALIEAVLEIASTPQSIVLDSFAGSGTTAHAVLSSNLRDGGNRKFILVEMEDYADHLTAERVRRVVNGYTFTGTQRDELLREKITWTKLKQSSRLLEQVTGLENAYGPSYDAIRKSVKDGELVVTGEKKIKDWAQGLGGSFTYCTLGDPIDMDSLLTGESLPSFEALASVLFHTATNTPLAAEAMATDALGLPGHGYLGEAAGSHIWLIYQPDLEFLKSRDAALTLAKARTIAEAKDGRHLVFAPARFVSQRILNDEGLPVEFAPLPFALYRVERD